MSGTRVPASAMTSRQFSVGLNYDYYKSDNKGLKIDPSMLSVSAEARF